MTRGRVSKQAKPRKSDSLRSPRFRRTKRSGDVAPLENQNGPDNESTVPPNIEEMPNDTAKTSDSHSAVSEGTMPPLGSFAAPKRILLTQSTSESCSPGKDLHSNDLSDQSLHASSPQSKSDASKVFEDGDRDLKNSHSCGIKKVSSPILETQAANNTIEKVPPSLQEAQPGSIPWPTPIMGNHASHPGSLHYGTFAGSIPNIPPPIVFPDSLVRDPSMVMPPPPQGFNTHPPFPVPHGLFPNPFYPGSFPFNSGSWCQIIGPTGHPMMAWVPSGPGPQLHPQDKIFTPSRTKPKSRSPQTFKLTTYEAQREHIINEQNKERLRIREMRRAETLRRYMRSGSAEGDPNTEGPAHDRSSTENKPSGERRRSITENKLPESPSSTQSNHTIPDSTRYLGGQLAVQGRPIPLIPGVAESWQGWMQPPINQSDQMSNAHGSLPAYLTPDSHTFKKTGYLRNSHKLYGKSQPRSYGYGDIIPQCVEQKETVTQYDRDRAMKMLTESFETFQKKRQSKPSKTGPSRDELADSAALLANYNRSAGLHVRNVAHRRIEEEYANQRREFHDAVDTLQMPAIKNSQERWICSLCPAEAPTFLYYKHLLRHAAHHLDIKPFKCPFCSRCFRRSDTARRHQLSCVQLSLAVKERNRDRSSAASSRKNKPEAVKVSHGNAQNKESTLIHDDDETSEEELRDSDDDTRVGDDASAGKEAMSRSLPPVVMPLQD